MVPSALLLLAMADVTGFNYLVWALLPRAHSQTAQSAGIRHGGHSCSRAVAALKDVSKANATCSARLLASHDEASLHLSYTRTKMVDLIAERDALRGKLTTMRCRCTVLSIGVIACAGLLTLLVATSAKKRAANLAAVDVAVAEKHRLRAWWHQWSQQCASRRRQNAGAEHALWHAQARGFAAWRALHNNNNGMVHHKNHGTSPISTAYIELLQRVERAEEVAARRTREVCRSHPHTHCGASGLSVYVHFVIATEDPEATYCGHAHMPLGRRWSSSPCSCTRVSCIASPTGSTSPRRRGRWPSSQVAGQLSRPVRSCR
jgi:hypothetical protein